MGYKLNLHGAKFSYEKKNVAEHRVKSLESYRLVRVNMETSSNSSFTKSPALILFRSQFEKEKKNSHNFVTLFS